MGGRRDLHQDVQGRLDAFRRDGWTGADRFAGLAVRRAAESVVDKLLNTRFEPSGITANANIRFVSSVLDYIARWLGGRFISADYLKLNAVAPAENAAASAPAATLPPMNKAALDAMQMALSTPKLSNAHEGAPTCSECGMLMVPNGACYKCENCGSTSGCS